MGEQFITHFQSQSVSVTENEVSEEIIVFGLVKENQPLITLDLDDSSPVTYTLSPGIHSELSSDKQTITATRTGYPTLNQVKEGMVTTLSVDIAPLITISEDSMFVMLTLYPAVAGKPIPSCPDILALCREMEITNGIDTIMIQETIDKVIEQGCPQLDIPIARGLLPVNGKDAYLRFEVEIGPLPGKIMGDGTIDWRERKIFVGINKDELIATKIDPTEGTSGVDVYGLAIPQKPGRDIKVKVAGDVEYNEESKKVVAICAGVLSIVNETDVKVSAKQTIDGDVDFSVGNIESNDGLEIKGDVKPGFCVDCRGDVLIEGHINDGKVNVKGNTKVQKGLIGESATLVTEGDVEISFVERGGIKSGGTVIISKGSYYANISSDKKIMCRSDCKIVGGSFSCGDDFIGGNIGSDNATPLSIAVGVEPSRFEQYRRQKKRAKELEHELETLINLHGKEYVENREYKKIEETWQKLTSNMKKFNLIKNSPLYSKNDPVYTHSTATISVSGRIVSGTKLQIGNTRTTVLEESSSIRFHIDPATGHIVAIPYVEGKA